MSLSGGLFSPSSSRGPAGAFSRGVPSLPRSTLLFGLEEEMREVQAELATHLELIVRPWETVSSEPMSCFLAEH